jgi:hypothetical protein
LSIYLTSLPWTWKFGISFTCTFNSIISSYAPSSFLNKSTPLWEARSINGFPFYFFSIFLGFRESNISFFTAFFCLCYFLSINTTFLMGVFSYSLNSWTLSKSTNS